MHTSITDSCRRRCGKWIREGFHSLVVQQLEEDRKNKEAMSQPLIACGQERVFRYSGGALGVRDKIFWEPENSSWFLKVSKPKHSTKDYCVTNSLHLKVSYAIVGEEFRLTREKTLIDACVAWNAIDGSKKHRISLPAAGTGPTAIQAAKVQQYIDGAVVQSESDVEHDGDSESD